MLIHVKSCFVTLTCPKRGSALNNQQNCHDTLTYLEKCFLITINETDKNLLNLAGPWDVGIISQHPMMGYWELIHHKRLISEFVTGDVINGWQVQTYFSQLGNLTSIPDRGSNTGLRKSLDNDHSCCLSGTEPVIMMKNIGNGNLADSWKEISTQVTFEFILVCL